MGHCEAVKRRLIEIATEEPKQLPKAASIDCPVPFAKPEALSTTAGVVSPLHDVEGASQRVKGERAVDAARLAIVHVASHSRQRHKVLTVIVWASVSTRLPWQNGPGRWPVDCLVP